MEEAANVLIIDDEHDVAFAIAEKLLFNGIKADVATTMEAAQALLGKNKYQVVTTDIFHTNSDVTGDFFIVENREQLKNSSIIVYTYTQPVNIARLSELQEMGVSILKKGDIAAADQFVKLIQEKLGESKESGDIEPTYPTGFELLNTIDLNAGWIGQIAWSPDGKSLAAHTLDRGMVIWNGENESGFAIDTTSPASGGVAWSPTGTLAYTLMSHVALANAGGMELSRFIDEKEGNDQWTPALSWSPDGKTLAIGNRYGLIRLYETESWELARTFEVKNDWLFALAWSRDSALLAAAGDSNVLRVWSVESAHQEPLQGHTTQITCLASCPTEDLLASGSADKTVRIWDPTTSQHRRTLEGHTGRITSVSFSFDGSLLASKSIDGTVKLWRTDKWELIATLDEPAVPPNGLYTPGIAFHPRELTLATLGAENAKIRIWKLNPGLLLRPDEESILSASVSDQPAATDSLGFEPYVKALARFLTDERTKPPLTLSIEGEWGSGKSSFMLQLEEELRHAAKRQRIKKLLKTRWQIRMRKERIPTPIRHRQWWFGLWPLLALPREERYPTFLSVRFNAWRHDKDSSLWASFALALLHKLSKTLPAPVRALTHLKLTARRFKWSDGWPVLMRTLMLSVSVLALAITMVYLLYTGGIEKILGNATEAKGGEVLLTLIKGSGVFGSVIVFLYLLKQLKDTIGDPFKSDLKKFLQTPDYDHQISFIEQFHEDFGNIVQTFAGKNKVYVFIDDLDRTEVPKAADLMQAINLLISDSPQVFFIVGMDRDKVAAGLAVKYEKILPYLLTIATDEATDNANAATQKDNSLNTVRGLDFGYSFIEKFIQIPFRIPQPAETGLAKLLDHISPLSTETTVIIDEPETTEVQVKPKDIPVVTQPSSTTSQTASPPTTPAPTPEQPPTPEQEERRERIRIAVTKDSATVRKIVQMVAPALDYNPRRIKQFINMFRLKALIAAETGLFDAPANALSHRGLTLPQLGKFVAISLKWPRLLADLNEDNSLLRELDKWAAGREHMVKPKHWTHHSDLAELLSYGCGGSQDPFEQSKPADYTRYTLANIDAQRLLRITPPIRPSRHDILAG